MEGLKLATIVLYDQVPRLDYIYLNHSATPNHIANTYPIRPIDSSGGGRMSAGGRMSTGGRERKDAADCSNKRPVEETQGEI